MIERCWSSSASLRHRELSRPPSGPRRAVQHRLARFIWPACPRPVKVPHRPMDRDNLRPGRPHAPRGPDHRAASPRAAGPSSSSRGSRAWTSLPRDYQVRARRAATAGRRRRRMSSMTTGQLRSASPWPSPARPAHCCATHNEGTELQISAKSTPTDLVARANHAAEHLIARQRLTAAQPRRRRSSAKRAATAPGPASGVHSIVDPLRRHGQLPASARPPIGPSASLARTSEGSRRHHLQPPARRALLCRARRRPGRSTAERSPHSTKEGMAAAIVAHGFGYDAEVRPAQAAIAAPLLPPVRDLRPPSAPPRSTSRGRPAAASTPAQGTASTPRTSPRAGWSANAPGWSCARSSRSARPRRACVVAPPTLVDALDALVGVIRRRRGYG